MKFTKSELNNLIRLSDSIKDRKDRFLTEEAKELKRKLGLYKKPGNQSGIKGKHGENSRPWNYEVTEAMNDALQQIVDGRSLEEASNRLKQCLQRYESLFNELNIEDQKRMRDVISRGKRILEKLKSSLEVR